MLQISNKRRVHLIFFAHEIRSEVETNGVRKSKQTWQSDLDLVTDTSSQAKGEEAGIVIQQFDVTYPQKDRVM